MIQTTSPAAASKKWLRISGGRIRLPASCCWRIPPRLSQIDSRTTPPPAVMTQATSAAHFIAPPLDSCLRAAPSPIRRGSLYREKGFSKTLGANLPVARRKHHENATLRLIFEAALCLAPDLAGVDAFDRLADERRPHASV